MIYAKLILFAACVCGCAGVDNPVPLSRAGLLGHERTEWR